MILPSNLFNLLILSFCLLLFVSPQQSFTTTTTTTASPTGTIIINNNGYGSNVVGPTDFQIPGVSQLFSIVLHPGQSTTFYVTNGLLRDRFSVSPLVGFDYSYTLNDKPDWVTYDSNNKIIIANPPLNWTNPSGFNLAYSDTRNNSLTIRVNFLNQGTTAVNQIVYNVGNGSSINNVYTIIYPLFTTTTTNLSSIRANNYGILTNMATRPWTTFQTIRSLFGQQMQNNQVIGTTTTTIPQTQWNQGATGQLNNNQVTQQNTTFLYSQTADTGNTLTFPQTQVQTQTPVTQTTQTTTTQAFPAGSVLPQNFINSALNNQIHTPAVPSTNILAPTPTISTLSGQGQTSLTNNVQPIYFNQTTTTTTLTQPTSSPAFTTNNVNVPVSSTVPIVSVTPLVVTNNQNNQALGAIVNAQATNTPTTTQTTTQTTRTIQTNTQSNSNTPSLISNTPIVSVTPQQTFNSQTTTTSTSTPATATITTPTPAFTSNTNNNNLISFGSGFNSAGTSSTTTAPLTVTHSPQTQTVSQNNESTIVRTTSQVTAVGTPQQINNWQSSIPANTNANTVTVTPSLVVNT